MALQTHDVAARDGLSLNLWERSSDTNDGEAVLFVHGSITCARALFAPPVTGDDSYSWLAAPGERGRTSFALDIRGYGDSDRPAELCEPPEENGPPVRADLAANDAADALGYVRERFDTVHLVGVSWGTNICGRLVERDDPAVASLVQCAPVYRTPYDVEDGLAALGLDPDLDAYYYQDRATVESRQGEDTDALFEAIWRTQIESNQGVDENRYIAQTGALADFADCCADDPPYDAVNIDVPTLVVRGSDDEISWRADATALYDELGTPDAEYLELAGADHYAMHSERRRALYDAVNRFHDRT
ncbi:alpha/beta hydrolase [Halococcus saccharolyticus]|uniref:Alpha/beta fold family hydrolase n=1 Tax=Halococcus saccharolyticus DSM 5350 TaxID=1227455 RepID=M0MEJ0_9EURY|nr:alpha/beta fold hydrolase [Halococcus saccharolyticus]EMA43753.1 alpha/beta fold family hydrolase [Halococcus saccharolyticus DSM 5350]